MYSLAVVAGRLNKCGVISPRFDVSLGDIEQLAIVGGRGGSDQRFCRLTKTRLKTWFFKTRLFKTRFFSTEFFGRKTWFSGKKRGF